MLRRDFLRLSGLTGAVLLSPAGRAWTTLSPAGAAVAPPQTGFEQSNGASWTTHAQEMQFLSDVAAASPRVRITEIGRTLQDRPLHLVAIGDPAPPEADVAKQAPITLFVCSQHGNEPAGRETGLKLIRDLAFSTDKTILRQLAEQTILVVPSANPDGRNANRRENSQGVDINRDHLNLTTLEARAIAAVVRDWSPDLVLDLHEYGPSIPVLYDDDLLYLWPRNLNADPAVRGLSRRLCLDYIKTGAEAAGYTADEYGLATVDNKTIRVGDDNANQTAGDQDEGICRNSMGLRHSLGVLVESAVTQNPRRGPDELSAAGLNRRRVASQMQVTADTLRFMREEGRVAKYASDDAPIQAAKSSRPVYFGGADNDAPTAAEVQNPPPVAYRLTAADAAKVATAFSLHGIVSQPDGDGAVLVPMRQAARPLIPLLLDPRGSRKSVSGTAIYES